MAEEMLRIARANETDVAYEQTRSPGPDRLLRREYHGASSEPRKVTPAVRRFPSAIW
ncbi:MAG TPA: hypothetical protein VN767_20545 [Streptosporangiaceae bacterium]|nr:hypothetical protein [Streptosporangiaceae bacterium]